MGPGLGGRRLGSGVGGIGSGVGDGGIGSGAGPGGVGSGAGVGGSGSIGGMTMIGRYPEIALAPPAYRRTMLPPEVVAYYECGDEQDRLTARTGRLEWARTWVLLQRHLPEPKATIVDVGGGPGAYAIPLALAGHDVHLVDAMPLHVAQARQAAAAAETRLASAEVGDARELAFPDASADAVLLLGPLYHLLEAGRAGRRPRRGTPGAAARRRAGRGRGQPVRQPHRGAAVRLGLRPPRDRRVRPAHRHPPQPGRAAAPLHHRALRPSRGARGRGRRGRLRRRSRCTRSRVRAPWSRTPDEWLDDPARRNWLLRQLDRIETEPSLLGASPHVMAIARR